MKSTKKPGRPTEYDPARNAMVKQLYALGAVDDEAIKALGVALSGCNEGGRARKSVAHWPETIYSAG
ncbi:MAG: hypothetical protein Q3M24_21625 [Candidatus Electrothrix aestuarii]|uniref:Uncharacterized protein n=1 Tax=Candidatus Electrothrix aestuarii TaxID=3062594 RepID=A0AAU8LVF6_9BACT|nr:hypothetical protein [Candidatus Electrothrix aestuarii]